MHEIVYGKIPLKLSARLQYELHEEFVVFLPQELEELFRKTGELYNQRENVIFETVRNRERNNDADRFFNLLQMGVRNGIAATYYNLLTFKRLTQELQQKAERTIRPFKPDNTAIIGFTVDKLVYEYEHFTFHSRALLDRLNWFLNYYFMEDTRNLYRLYKTLANNKSEDNKTKTILSAIDNHRSFLDTQISSDKATKRTERDQLAHREEIQFTFLNLHIHTDGSVKSILFTKDDPFGAEAYEVLERRFNELSVFAKEILTEFLEL